MSIRPILVLSPPRAGSTMLQRVLAAHPRVATASEPWLLLPLAYSIRERGVKAEYWHTPAAQAIADFADTLPGGRERYLRELGDAARRLYAASAGSGADHFLDKTPHYHLIVDDLQTMLPDAKIVFLWRNPLAVVASLLSTFRDGRWEPALFELDLQRGIRSLADAAPRLDAAASVRYEDLLHGQAGWESLFGGLGLDFQPEFLERFTDVQLRGRYGDPTGIRQYDSLSGEPEQKWMRALATRTRKRWCQRYLTELGAKRLATMGYSLDELLTQLEQLPSGRGSIQDLARSARARASAGSRSRAMRIGDSPRPVADSAARRLRSAVRARARRILPLR